MGVIGIFWLCLSLLLLWRRVILLKGRGLFMKLKVEELLCLGVMVIIMWLMIIVCMLEFCLLRVIWREMKLVVCGMFGGLIFEMEFGVIIVGLRLICLRFEFVMERFRCERLSCSKVSDLLIVFVFIVEIIWLRLFG